MNYPQSTSEESPQHPSQPIHDAAYPDTPYQPGFGPQRPLQTVTSHDTTSHQTGSISPSPHSPPQVYNRNRELGPGARQPSPSSWPHGGTSSSPANFPDVPPPPYVPNEQPTPNLSPSWTGSHASAPGESIPLQNFPRPRPVVSTATSSTVPFINQQPASPYPQGSSISTPASTQANKYGPNALAQRRRRRRKICLVVIAVIIIFIIALVIGIGLGVIKGSAHNNNSNGGGP